MDRLSFERKIGFDGLRELLGASCHTEPGRECVRQMTFSTDFKLVERRLKQTAEMLELLSGPTPPPLGELSDIASCLKAATVEGSVLAGEDFLRIKHLLEMMDKLRGYFSVEERSSLQLSGIGRSLPAFPELTLTIDRTIDRYGNVKDSASVELADIRSRLRGMAGRVNAIMRRVMASAVSEGWIEQDVVPTVRDGRLVIPVSPAYKRRFNGIVHDESATGKTVFIEPAEVVEHNNRLRELEMEERREIQRIFAELTAFMRPDIPVILSGYNDVGHLDFIKAKAELARQDSATMPTLHDKPEVEWYHACHPMLRRSLERHGKEIVPLDITLSEDNRILIISGPNAGGKSVCLKTVGFIQYMLQCGMLPAVFENSHCGIFSDIFIDIGDDQSIEDDLSTYSSHLRNMKTFVAQGKPTSLILIDEFGGGTEPQIGGAIAQAILHSFNDKRMWGVITTHFQNLKHYAEDTAGLINGSMLYDRHLMQPTFRLSIGNPGSSFALEIARKIGLPADIVAEAREIVGSDYVNLDNYLLDIARDKRYWEQKRRAIHAKEKDLEAKLSELTQKTNTIKQERRRILDEAKTQAQTIIDSSNAAVERTIHAIKEANAEREATKTAREELRRERRKYTIKATHKTSAPEKKQISEGDSVKLDGEGSIGTVIRVSGKTATVAFGQIKTNVEASRLKVCAKKEGEQRATPTMGANSMAESRRRQLNFKQEIDLRGMRVDEALQAVIYFLDDAIQFHAEKVRILHGTGTGALRQAIREMLKDYPGVAKYHDEDVRFGGAGITVVTLD